jgi:hypothetical protein
VPRLHGRKTRCVVVRAEQQEGTSSAAQPQAVQPGRGPPRSMPPRGPPVMLGPDGKPLQVRGWRRAATRRAWARGAHSTRSPAPREPSTPPLRPLHDRWCPSSAPARRRGPASRRWTAARATRTLWTGGAGDGIGMAGGASRWCRARASRHLQRASRVPASICGLGRAAAPGLRWAQSHPSLRRAPRSPNRRSRVALLAGGDAAVLLAFAAIGRINHGEPISGALDTALPFLIGARRSVGAEEGHSAGAEAQRWRSGAAWPECRGGGCACPLCRPAAPHSRLLPLLHSAAAAGGRARASAAAQPHTPAAPLLPPPPRSTGWFAAAPLLGGYGKAARGGAPGPAAGAAAKVWAVGVPLGLAVRGISKGYVPPTPFIIVSLAATAVLMVGWRAALAAATPEVRAPRQGRGRRRTQRGSTLGALEKGAWYAWTAGSATAGCRRRRFAAAAGPRTRRGLLEATASPRPRRSPRRAPLTGAPVRAARQAAAPASKAQLAKARQNKKGSPLEFLSLLMSLTKRW